MAATRKQHRIQGSSYDSANFLLRTCTFKIIQFWFRDVLCDDIEPYVTFARNEEVKISRHLQLGLSVTVTPVLSPNAMKELKFYLLVFNQ